MVYVAQSLLDSGKSERAQRSMEVAPVQGLNVAYQASDKYPAASHYEAAPPVPPPPPQKPESRIWGLRKVSLGLIVALVVSLVTVIAVAVVAEVVVSKHRSQQQVGK